MCGRFGLTRPDRLRLERLGVALATPLEPRFNIAPGTEVLAVRETGGQRRADWLRWGANPSWGKGGGPIVNARSEGGFAKGAFRQAIHQRRCLVPADVFFEWQVVPGRRRKQPWALALPGGEPFALGAIWEPSVGMAGPEPRVALLTTGPNGVVLPLHDRMPVIIAPDRYLDWLDPRTPEPAYREMVMPWPSDQLEAWPITERVNSVAHDDAMVLTRAEVSPGELELF